MFTENLLRLRRQRNLSQQALAKKTGISLVAYRNIETGRSEPKEETLSALANALNISGRELFMEIKPLAAVRFRAQKRMKRRAQVLSDVNRWLMDFNDIENVLQDRVPYKLENIEIKPQGTESHERAIEAAREARSALNLGEKGEPIRDICGLLESAGIKVYQLALESEGFFGLSVAKDDGGPAIVVNVWDRIPVERRIFSAAHELGHLLLHLHAFHVEQEDENEDEEKEANWFASHFLMPEESFKKEWQETRGLPWIERVLKVKRIFRVSYRTVLFRLKEDYGYPDTLWREFNFEYSQRFATRLLGNTEPRALDDWDFVEDRLKRLVRKGIESYGITLSRGAEILGVKTMEMRRIANAWAT